MTAATETYDYVVVGAGSAGCVLAARLSADSATRVLLLEAGPRDRHPLIHIPLGVGELHARGLFDWGYRGEPEPGLGGRRLAALRGKVLGGSSSINVMGYTRGDRADYDRWAREGATGWSWREVRPYFQKLEAWEDGPVGGRGGHGPVAIERARVRDPLARAWFEAAEALGIAENPDICGGDSAGFGITQYTIARGRRASSANAYLRPAAGRPNLVVRTGALASRILLSGTRATGVEYRQRGHIVRAAAARSVVLCAGAFNTPQLLMLSGIGPAGHLAAHGIKAIADLPVGQNLQDHIAVVNLYARRQPGEFHAQMRLDRMLCNLARAQLFGTGFAARIPAGLLGFVRSDPALAAPDLEFMFPIAPPDARLWLPGWRRPYGDAFGIRPAILHPRSRGEVTLRSADPADPVRIRFNALAEPEDLASLRLGFELARELSAQRPLDPFRGEEIAPGPEVRGRRAIDAFLRANAATVNHPCGTSPIGAVLDPELRVKGVDGLRVVDASAMPDLTSGHINACVLMMAERGADLLGPGSR